MKQKSYAAVSASTGTITLAWLPLAPGEHQTERLCPAFSVLVTIHLDGGVMGENVFAAALRADKTEPFGIVEPLNSTHFHTSTSFVNLYK